MVNQLDDPRDKADVLVHIAKLARNAGDSESADRLLSEALIWTAQIEDGLFKSNAIESITEIGSADQVEHAAGLVKSLGGSHRSFALRQLMFAYQRLGNTNRAVAVLRQAAAATTSPKTKNETWYGDREHELSSILADAARAGLADEALKMASRVKDPFSKGDVLSASAVQLAEQKQYRRAIREARIIHYEIERIEALVEVANRAAKTGDKSFASEALSYALKETQKDIFDPEQDIKTKSLVSIALAYYNAGDRENGLKALESAEKVSHTIEKPGFQDSGMSQVALTYARFRMFEKALEVVANMPSRQWSEVEPHSLAGIAEQMIDAGERERALGVLSKAYVGTTRIDCTYFKYAISAQACFGKKAETFIEIGSVFEKAGAFEKATEMLDLAVTQNQYKKSPPHQVIQDEAYIHTGSDPVGEQSIVSGYLGAGQFQKAIEVASKIESARDRVLAVATIEFKLAGVKERPSFQLFGC